MAVLAALVVWFYRDPDRTAPEGDGLFISPADGRVVEISEAEHPFTGPSVKVGIFMNVLSVHVNRAPCMGRVDYLEYVPGRKIAAFAPKAAEVNERNLVGLSTPYGPDGADRRAPRQAHRLPLEAGRGPGGRTALRDDPPGFEG